MQGKVFAKFATRQPNLSLPRVPFANSRLTARPCTRTMATGTDKLDKSTSEDTWRQLLGRDEYYILRQKGTEAPGSGAYNKHKEDGVYRCGGCGTPLYKSETKFDSGCGWPAFYAEIPGTLDRHVDTSMGMKRTEITCSNCGGHMGHVFENEGFPNPTNERHCVNSKSLKFVKK